MGLCARSASGAFAGAPDRLVQAPGINGSQRPRPAGRGQELIAPKRSFTRLWLLVRDSSESEAVSIGCNSLLAP
jgi:hypothetical protein